MITRSRIDRTKNPNIPAVQNYLAVKYEAELAKATTQRQIKRVKRLFSGIKDEDIFIEYVREPVNISQSEIRRFLCCFSVPKLGYAILDAKIAYTTLDEVLDYFNVPVQKVTDYADLVTRIRAGLSNVVFKVESGSGQFGICIDNRLTLEQRHSKITETLGGVVFNLVANYTGASFSIDTPNIGELSVSYPGCDTYALEIYPLEEIMVDSAYNGNSAYDGSATYGG